MVESQDHSEVTDVVPCEARPDLGPVPRQPTPGELSHERGAAGSSARTELVFVHVGSRFLDSSPMFIMANITHR